MDQVIADPKVLPDLVLLASTAGTIIPQQEYDRIVEKIARVGALRIIDTQGIIAWRMIYPALIIDQAGDEWLEQWLKAHQPSLKLFRIGESVFVGNELFEFALNNRDQIIDLMSKAGVIQGFDQTLKSLLNGIMILSAPKTAFFISVPVVNEDHFGDVMAVLGVMAQELKGKQGSSEPSAEEQHQSEALPEPIEFDSGDLPPTEMPAEEPYGDPEAFDAKEEGA